MSLQTDLLEQYLEQHSSQEPAELRRLRREAHVHLLQPRMLSGHLQGRLLKMLVQLVMYWSWAPTPPMPPYAWPKGYKTPLLGYTPLSTTTKWKTLSIARWLSPPLEIEW